MPDEAKFRSIVGDKIRETRASTGKGDVGRNYLRRPDILSTSV
jgi:hypothetical protein